MWRLYNVYIVHFTVDENWLNYLIQSIAVCVIFYNFKSLLEYTISKFLPSIDVSTPTHHGFLLLQEDNWPLHFANLVCRIKADFLISLPSI